MTIIENMSNKEYHAEKRVSSTLLKNIRELGMFPAFKKSPFNPSRIEEEKDAYALGSAYHGLIGFPKTYGQVSDYRADFERVVAEYDTLSAKDKKDLPPPSIKIDMPETTWHIADFGLTRANKGYEKYKAFNSLSGDDLILNWREFELACEMARYMDLYCETVLGVSDLELIGKELSIFFEYRGVPCRIRPDRLYKIGEDEDGKGMYLFLDFKSTRVNSEIEMARLGENQGWDIQAAFYIDGIAQEYGVPKENVQGIFVCQSKEYPEIIRHFEHSKASLDEARIDIDTTIDDFWERWQNYKTIADFAFLEWNPETLPFFHWERRLPKEDLNG